jgi:type 1 glutamine amidotransferase
MQRHLLVLACGWLTAASAADAPVRVLIIDGFSNHDWRTTTQRIREQLDADGGFAVAVSTSPDASATRDAMQAWRPPVAEADVVLMNCNDLGKPVIWPDAVKTQLEAFVRGGHGLYVFHSANNAFAHWPEYNRMIGLGWRAADFGPAAVVEDDGTLRRIPAGEGPGTSHGPRTDALITRVGEHPIHRGFPRQWRAADLEVYTYARGPAEHIDVLSHSRDNKFGLAFPIEWTVRYGDGRVYNSTLGHLWKDNADPAAFRCAGFRALLPRTVRWLAGRTDNSPAPTLSPDQPTLVGP